MSCWCWWYFFGVHVRVGVGTDAGVAMCRSGSTGSKGCTCCLSKYSSQVAHFEVAGVRSPRVCKKLNGYQGVYGGRGEEYGLATTCGQGGRGRLAFRWVVSTTLLCGTRLTIGYVDVCTQHRLFSLAVSSFFYFFRSVLVERGSADGPVQRRDRGVCLAHQRREEAARRVRKGDVFR